MHLHCSLVAHAVLFPSIILILESLHLALPPWYPPRYNIVLPVLQNLLSSQCLKVCGAFLVHTVLLVPSVIHASPNFYSPPVTNVLYSSSLCALGSPWFYQFLVAWFL